MIKREHIKQAIDAISMRNKEIGYSLDEMLGMGIINIASGEIDPSGDESYHFFFEGRRVLVNRVLFFQEGTAPIEQGLLIKYGELAQKTGGEAGTLVDAIPLEASFRRDRFNEGVFAEWYLPAHDASDWETKNTFLTWDAQDKPEDEKGHDYDGYGWYRMTVNVPAGMVNKPLSLHLGGVINEGWVWINGNYAGHRAWKLWWAGRDALEMDVDVTGKVKAGANVIAIRVWNNAEIGGLYRRGFLWSPKP